MNNSINSIAVLGSGTMGAGIAALCLEKGFKGFTSRYYRRGSDKRK